MATKRQSKKIRQWNVPTNIYFSFTVVFNCGKCGKKVSHRWPGTYRHECGVYHTVQVDATAGVNEQDLGKCWYCGTPFEMNVPHDTSKCKPKEQEDHDEMVTFSTLPEA